MVLMSNFTSSNRDNTKQVRIPKSFTGTVKIPFEKYNYRDFEKLECAIQLMGLKAKLETINPYVPKMPAANWFVDSQYITVEFTITSNGSEEQDKMAKEVSRCLWKLDKYNPNMLFPIFEQIRNRAKSEVMQEPLLGDD